jgi:hypothetical protein
MMMALVFSIVCLRCLLALLDSFLKVIPTAVARE